ncbi:MAG: lauroyl acyltransferase, partial [Bacteroidetes bacterium]
MLADGIYVVIYYLIGYRKKTVFQNLKLCFPEKTESEIKQIAKDFYRHFADLIVEVLKTWSMSNAEMKQRVRIKNPELMAEYVANKQSAIGLTGHLGNWEWLLPICSLESKSENIMAVYKELNNASFDKFIFDLRSRFGGKPIKMDKIFSELRKCKSQNLFSLTGLIADQAPMKKDAEYWTTFFGIESAFFAGITKLPEVFQLPVVFISMRKIKRGFY